VPNSLDFLKGMADSSTDVGRICDLDKSTWQLKVPFTMRSLGKGTLAWKPDSDDEK